MLGTQLRRRHLTPDRLQHYLRLKSELYRFLVVFMPASLLSRESLAPCPIFRDHLTTLVHQT